MPGLGADMISEDTEHRPEPIHADLEMKPFSSGLDKFDARANTKVYP